MIFGAKIQKKTGSHCQAFSINIFFNTMSEQFHPSTCLYIITPLQNPPFPTREEAARKSYKGLN
jgi:hypothetical protein